MTRSFSVIADLLKQKSAEVEGDEELGQPRGSALTPAQATALAEQIVAAGAARRGETPIANPPPMLSEAARSAGTATYQTPVKDPAAVAATILAAGRKARGER